MDLAGKVAIVTGGAAGMGKGIAGILAEYGAAVAIADINEELARQTASEFEAQGFQAKAFAVDVRDSQTVGQLIQNVSQSFGSLDILVNNAGIGQSRSVLDMEEDEWDAVLTTNLKGAFLCAQATAKEMISHGTRGRIVNIVSTAAENARLYAAAYCASKAGLVQFTKALALELGEHGITVNAVGPGLTLTDSEVRSPPSESYQTAFLKEVPLARTGRPSDIAQAVAFLVSAEAEYITGQVMYVDGGYSAGKLSVRD